MDQQKWQKSKNIKSRIRSIDFYIGKMEGMISFMQAYIDEGKDINEEEFRLAILEDPLSTIPFQTMPLHSSFYDFLKEYKMLLKSEKDALEIEFHAL